jgi:hypothetical protein
MFGLMKKAMESRPFSPAKCDFSSSSRWEKNQLNDEEKQMKTKIETLTLTSFLQSREGCRKAEDNDVYDAGFSQCLR